LHRLFAMSKRIPLGRYCLTLLACIILAVLGFAPAVRLQQLSAPSIASTAGTLQSATVNTPFGTQWQATVTDQNSNPVSGVAVTFSAPSAGPSGIFQSGGVTYTLMTNAQGVATAQVFTANGIAGYYSDGIGFRRVRTSDFRRLQSSCGEQSG